MVQRVVRHTVRAVWEIPSTRTTTCHHRRRHRAIDPNSTYVISTDSSITYSGPRDIHISIFDPTRAARASTPTKPAALHTRRHHRVDHSSRNALTSSNGTSPYRTCSTKSTTNHYVQRQRATHPDTTPTARHSTETEAFTAAATLHQAGYDGTDGRPHDPGHGTCGSTGTATTSTATTSSHSKQLRWTYRRRYARPAHPTLTA